MYYAGAAIISYSLKIMYGTNYPILPILLGWLSEKGT